MTYDPEFIHVSDRVSINYITNQLEYNLKSFLDYGFLAAGGFINVQASGNNVHGMSQYRLYPVNDTNYKQGQVWQTARKNWVHESGIGGPLVYGGVHGSGYGSNNAPIYISGLVIDSLQYNDEVAGTYAHKLNYRDGRVIFDTAIPTNTKIDLNYSYKWVQVYDYSEAEWWKEIQYNTDSNTDHLNRKDKGDFFVDPKHRVQLPAIVIETVPRSFSSPYRLGDHSMVLDQDVLVHVVAQNHYDRNNITDMVRLQQDRVLNMYDVNTVSKSGVYTYNFDGTLNASRLDYKSLVQNNNYLHNTCRLKNMVVSEVESVNPDLYESTIRLTAEIIIV
tara:strand:- start:238 stop:1236 length:999 start_codon:yes stop_codon:yes gene_type:complete